MAVTVPEEIGSTSPAAVLPGVLFAATLADRDRAATATEGEVVRIGSWVHVTETGLRYRLVTRSPLVWVADPEGGSGLGDFVVALNIAARDSLTATQGLRARVLTLPYVFEYDGTDWNIVEVVPNRSQAFVDEVNEQTEGAIRYISTASGDDEADGLTPGTAWQTGDRFRDELPDDPRMGDGIQGIYTAIVLDDDVAIPENWEMPKIGTVFVRVIPDLENTAAFATFLAPGAGTRPVSPDPNTPVKTLGSQFSYSVAPFGAITADNTHFVSTRESFGGAPFYFPYCLDGTLTDGPGGDLRVIAVFDALSFTGEARVFAYANVPKLAPNDTSGFGNRLRFKVRGRVSVSIEGFRILAADVDTLENDGASLDATLIQCRYRMGGLGTPGSSGPVYDGPTIGVASRLGEGTTPGSIRGLFLTAFTINSGEFSAEGGIMMRCTGVGPGQLHFGGFTGFVGSPRVSGDIDHIDFDGLSGAQEALHFQGKCHVRSSNGAQGLVFIDVSRAIHGRSGGFMQFNGGRVFGSQRFPSNLEGLRTEASGLASTSGLTDGLLNSVNPGDDITLGPVASPTVGPLTFNGTDLPNNDDVSGLARFGIKIS